GETLETRILGFLGRHSNRIEHRHQITPVGQGKAGQEDFARGSFEFLALKPGGEHIIPPYVPEFGAQESYASGTFSASSA
ncbi:hypothetical protein ACC694_38250, partial [Rhizobium ruizarguesonis]